MPVHVTYDITGDVYAIKLRSRPIARTVEVDGVHLVDLADDGSVVGIEVLDPDHAELRQVASEFGLTDQLPEIEAEVRKAVPPITRPGALYVSYTMAVATAAHYVPGSLALAKSGRAESKSLPPAREVELNR